MNEKLSRPPILESIFTVSFNSELSSDTLRSFKDLSYIRDHFPVLKEHFQKKGNEEKLIGVSSNSDLIEGFILQTSDQEDKVIQVKEHSISFHKIGNYDSWENLIRQFSIIIKLLQQSTTETIYTQSLSVRYINKVEFEQGNLTSYFNFLPKEVPGLDLDYDSFFLQASTKFEDLTSVITETILSDSTPPSFIIDLKVSKRQTVKLEDDAIWDDYKKIREYKNKLFFSIITDKTKSLFI